MGGWSPRAGAQGGNGHKRTPAISRAQSDRRQSSSISTATRPPASPHAVLTIHGRSRYPGLYAWLADGRRIPVRIPEGCLLLQAGKQMEWLTGGAVKAGFHEVRRPRLHAVWPCRSALVVGVGLRGGGVPRGEAASPPAPASMPRPAGLQERALGLAALLQRQLAARRARMLSPTFTSPAFPRFPIRWW